MEHARNMALVDPRLLDTLRSAPPSPLPTDTLGKKVQALDDEMMSILDRKDLDDRSKVTLYNQVLQRYNVLSDKHVKEPIRVVAVNESMPAAAAAAAAPGAGTAAGAPSMEGAPDTEADVADTVPKTMQAKARRLMEQLKINIAWITRGELIHEGVPVTGSNVVDPANDMLRKRKPIRRDGSHLHNNSEPSTCLWSWSVTSPGEPTYDRRRRPRILLVERQLLLVLLLLVVHEDHSVGHPSFVGAVRWNIPCSPHPGNENARRWCWRWEDF